MSLLMGGLDLETENGNEFELSTGNLTPCLRMVQIQYFTLVNEKKRSILYHNEDFQSAVC